MAVAVRPSGTSMDDQLTTYETAAGYTGRWERGLRKSRCMRGCTGGSVAVVCVARQSSEMKLHVGNSFGAGFTDITSTPELLGGSNMPSHPSANADQRSAVR